MDNSRNYVRTETAFSVAGSIIVSVLIYMLVFGVLRPVPTLGFGAYAFDFAPQGFMTALICTVLPGTITRNRIRRGTISRLPGKRPRLKTLWLRGLAFGLAALLFGALPVALTIVMSGTEEISWWAGLAGKILFGGAVAVAATPAALHAALRETAGGQIARR